MDHAPVLLAARGPLTVTPARRSLAVPLSVAAHMVLGLVLCGLAVPRRMPAVAPASSVEVVFAPAPAAEAPIRLAPAAIPLVRGPIEAEEIGPLPRLVVPAARVFRAVRAKPVPAGVAPAAVPSAVAVAPPTPKAPDFGLSLVGFEAQVHRAVQAAAVYPATARLQHRQGRAEIRFDYEDGGVRGAAVAQSSESSLLDRAALDAVQRAALPHKAGVRKLTMLVWVDFSLTAED